MDRPSLILVHKKRNALYSYTQSLSNAAAAGWKAEFIQQARDCKQSCPWDDGTEKIALHEQK